MSTMTLPSALDHLDFGISEEQRQLQQLTRRFLDDHYPLPLIRELMSSPAGHNPDLWQKLARETGLTGLLIPEEYGGAGLGIREAQIVAEEMGRTLFNGPFLSTAILSVLALVKGDKHTQAHLFPSIIEGTGLVAAASLSGEGPIATATVTKGSCHLNTSRILILDGHIANHLIIPAITEDGIQAFLVDSDASGLEFSLPPMFDQTRRFAEITMTGTPAHPLNIAGNALQEIQNNVLAVFAAELSGAAQACMDMAIAYAKERYQFGRPIGSFQAIKHKCADMLLLVEDARSAVAYAGACAEQAAEELPVAAAMAKARCSEAFTRIAGDTLQIHGGMGFTWDHDCHLYLKRARSSEIFLGSPAGHRQRLADLLEI